MEESNGETLELLEMMPKINSATFHGSRYVILSVDNPNEWHQENYEVNSWMYNEAKERNLMNNGLKDDEVNFPRSLGGFSTEFKENKYNLIITDKRLLYKDLQTWEHFSLARHFQKEMVLLIDNSDGVLPELMQQNYQNAVKAALLMNPEMVISEQKLFETIISLFYLGNVKPNFLYGNSNRINNTINDSYNFLKKVYGNQNSEYFQEDSLIYKNDEYCPNALAGKFETLPSSLKDYLFKNLGYCDAYDSKKVAKVIKKYFERVFYDNLKMTRRISKTASFIKKR